MDKSIIQEAREALSTLESEAHSLGMRAEYRHELAASIRAGLNAADKTTTPTTPQADGWVRCEDRLPTEADADFDNQVIGWSRSHLGATYCDVSMMPSYDQITHWKPTGLKRPQPPKEGAGDE